MRTLLGHPNVDEFVILLRGFFSVRFGRNKNSTEEKILDAGNGPLMITIPKMTVHTVTSIADSSEYLVVKEFNDTMIF